MKILIIEDELRIVESIKKGLELNGYAVDYTTDATEGYDLAQSEDYGLIILDLLLPGMSGYDVCQKLREEKNHTPIIILTAKDQLEDKLKGFELGADDYLTKPFAFEELLARVKALIRRPKSIVEQVIKVRNLTLNTNTFEVKRSGRSITLSNKEYAILTYLMENPGKILSKDQIIHHIWNYEDEVLPNTVEVFIRNLRLKLDAPFKKEKPMIKTVRGFGYKIG